MTPRQQWIAQAVDKHRAMIRRRSVGYGPIRRQAIPNGKRTNT